MRKGLFVVMAFRFWGTLLVVLCSVSSVFAQLSLSGVGTFTVDFDSTVSGVSNGVFTGSGFQASPSSGQQDSDAWEISGFSDGSLSFGGTQTSGDYSRGSSSGGVGTGGIYAFEVSSSNYALGFQPVGSDVTPGSFTLRLQNNTGSALTELTIQYTVYYRDDQNRSNEVTFSYSSDNSSYTSVSSLDVTSPATSTGSTWVSTVRSTTITGLSVTNGGYFYLQWGTDDVSGSGSRDEFALDDIEVTLVSVSGTSTESMVYDRGGESATISSLENDSPISSTSDGAQVWEFTLTDGDGTSADADTLPTLITSLRLTKGSDDGISNWGDAIRSTQLFKDGVAVDAATQYADSLVFELTGSEQEIADDDSAVFTLHISLINGSDPSIVDEANFHFQLASTDVTTDGTSTSSQMQSFTITSDSTQNAIDVSPTAMAFSQNATNTGINNNMSPSVSVAFTDTYGNIDIGQNGVDSIQITSSGSLNSTPQYATINSSGLAVFSSISHSASGTNLTLTATDVNSVVGGGSITSSTFDISTIPNLYFTEIADPSSAGNAKYVEIYNGSGATIDFSSDTWYVSRQSGNALSWDEVQLEGSIPDEGVYTIAMRPNGSVSGDFDATFSLTADNSSWGSSYVAAIAGDGDDTYCLFYGGDQSSGTLVDIYGEIGTDGTGEAWEYADLRATRKKSVTSSSSTWDSSEWDIGSSATADCTPKRLEGETRYHSADGTWSGGAPSSSSSATDVTIQSDTVTFSSTIETDSFCILADAGVILSSNVAIRIHGDLINDGHMEIEEDGQLIQHSGSGLSGSGSFSVIRTFKTDASQWHIFSPPLSDINIISFLPSDNLYDAFSFYGADQDWRYDFDLSSGSPTNTHANSPYTFFNSGNMLSGADGVFDPARGYFLPGTQGGTGERSYTGTVNNGNVSIDIHTSDVTGLSWTGNDWNLVGNPYPCDLDAVEFLNTNINKLDASSGLYFWDDISSNASYHEYDDYASWNLAGGVASANSSTELEDYIASFQGFWVSAKDESADGGETYSLSFTNDMRADTTSRPFYKRGRQRVWIRASNDSGYVNNILLALIPGTGDGVDPGYDARKLLGNPNFYFASMIDSLPMVIQSIAPLDSTESKRIPLLIGTGFEGLHLFEIDRTERLPEDEYELVLEDELEIKSQDLRKGPYVVYLDSAGEYRDRFYLRITRKTTAVDTIPDTTVVSSVKPIEATSLRIFQTDSWLVADGSDLPTPIQEMNLVDMQGRLVRSRQLGGTEVGRLNTSELPGGLYVLTVELSNNQIIHRKVWVADRR